MKAYNLKSAVRRGSMLTAAFVIAGASLLPFTSASADALNPLTNRSLTLSSSSPGWDYKDGSGNDTYAPPNSGANGFKSGNTFDFKVSTDSTATGTNEPVMAMTFQYCTTSAGNCQAPGDITNGNSNEDNVVNKKSDLNIVTATPSELSTLSGYVNTTSANGDITAIPSASGTGNNFVVYALNENDPEDDEDNVWEIKSGWLMTTQNAEPGASDPTGRQNQITLTHDDAGQGFTAGQRVKVVFFATNSNYITNPGSGAFFVKINTFKDADTSDVDNIIDGGVTVANVMNQSIQITTKVLETMEFSVGTVDPYTLQAVADDNGATPGGADESSQLFLANGHRVHGTCEKILPRLTSASNANTNNTLQLGNADGEFSLGTEATYSTHSYWRLSSNSSAGATVYYSGNTLSNTVNDKITPIYGSVAGDGLAAASQKGREQFGLALDNETTGQRLVSYLTERKPGKVYQNGADNAANGLLGVGNLGEARTQGVDASVTSASVSNLSANPSYHTPRLAPLAPTANYGGGTGVVNSDWNGGNETSGQAMFAFSETSQQIPVAIASQDNQVVDCVTGKMRYIANIAATTPAGIYTTKINYIAAPQY